MATQAYPLKASLSPSQSKSLLTVSKMKALLRVTRSSRNLPWLHICPTCAHFSLQLTLESRNNICTLSEGFSISGAFKSSKSSGYKYV